MNLIDLLSPEYFDESCACEHVDEEGKKKIAKEIKFLS